MEGWLMQQSSFFAMWYASIISLVSCSLSCDYCGALKPRLTPTLSAMQCQVRPNVTSLWAFMLFQPDVRASARLAYVLATTRNEGSGVFHVASVHFSTHLRLPFDCQRNATQFFGPRKDHIYFIPWCWFLTHVTVGEHAQLPMGLSHQILLPMGACSFITFVGTLARNHCSQLQQNELVKIEPSQDSMPTLRATLFRRSS